MSIEATKWARTADVQKSSSKLVLLELAHLVRAYATDWTAFASIEHLAKVTHLNRKTVIEALARLRKLGAIVDTGHRAGGSRSCPIYRLCPTAVPTVCAPTAETAAGNSAPYQPPGEPDRLDLDRQGALALDELAAEAAPTWPTDVDEDHGTADDYTATEILDVQAAAASALAADDAAPTTADSNSSATPVPPQAQPVDEAPSMRAPSAPFMVPGPAKQTPRHRRRRPSTRVVSG